MKKSKCVYLEFSHYSRNNAVVFILKIEVLEQWRVNLSSGVILLLLTKIRMWPNGVKPNNITIVYSFKVYKCRAKWSMGRNDPTQSLLRTWFPKNSHLQDPAFSRQKHWWAGQRAVNLLVFYCIAGLAICQSPRVPLVGGASLQCRPLPKSLRTPWRSPAKTPLSRGGGSRGLKWLVHKGVRETVVLCKLLF